MTPPRSHPFLRPAIAAPGQQAISIEHTSDHFIRTDSGQHSHGIGNRFRCLRAILPTPPTRQKQLRVHATVPVMTRMTSPADGSTSTRCRTGTHLANSWSRLRGWLQARACQDAKGNGLFAIQYYGCCVVDSYHEDRTHLGLGKGTPDGRTRTIASGRVLSHVRLGGLHHRYDRAA
jgi:hypothetical protein